MRPPDRPRVIRDAADGDAPPARRPDPRDLDPPDPDDRWQRIEPPPRRGPTPEPGFRQSNRRSVLEVVGVVVGFALALVGIFKLAAWLAVLALPLIPVSLDRSVGEMAYDQLASPSKQCTDPGPKAYVEALAKPLVEAANAEFTFEFRVIDDDTANAFALPGGYVAVNFGLLTEAKSGAEVAAVLAHELSHATQRHGVARILRKVSGFVAIGAVLGWVDFGGLAGVAADLIDSGYDRDQEREADRVGRDVMRSAAIDPRAMGIFFDRLAETEGPAFVRLVASHPPSAERAADARAAEPLAGPARDLPSPAGLRCHPTDSATP
jgi:predicted Zn-dependent protease